MNPTSKSAGAVVYVVDDDPSVREAISSLIRSVGLAVETFSSAQEFLRNLKPDVPGCLVLDVRLPGVSGLELQRELSATPNQLPIIVITGHGDIPMSVEAMKAGAIDFLTKPFRDRDLLDAIQRGIELHGEGLEQRKEIAELRTRYESLSGREREVMAMIVAGRLNQQIAAELGTAQITVKIQRSHVMRKMKAASFADLVRMAERLRTGSTR